jgi:predicted lipoprotein with Yx(FWY)xxD motif
MKRIALLLIAAATCAPVFAQTTDAPITTRTDEEEGEYLAAGSGHSLYLFKADTQGDPSGAGAVTTCFDDCLATWPPMVVDLPVVGDTKIDQSLIGTMTRPDGMLQLTYNGWPLYLYAEDIEPGDINGHDIESFGEDWYLIGPNGQRADRQADDSDRSDRGRNRDGDDDRDS